MEPRYSMRPTAPATEASEPFALSPMQAGMLFQSLLDPEHSRSSLGYDIEQLHLVLHEPLLVDRLGHAFTFVARRHPSLSASFVWEDVPGPRQRFVGDVVVPVESQDLRNAQPGELDARREAFFERDRRRGFDLRQAPLMRVTLLQTGAQTWELIWTFHHILLDGRSFATVLNEVFIAYDEIGAQRPRTMRPPPPPYPEFLRWLEQRDRSGDHAFFTALLAGKTTPTPLPGAESAARPLSRTGHGELQRELDATVLRAAHDCAERTGSTLSTIFEAAWALVLSRYTHDTDVLFATLREGRRTALEGRARDSVGLFINTLPVRADMTDTHSVAQLLAALQAHNLALREHEHTALVEIQAASELPRGTGLFESCLMFENRELQASLELLNPQRFEHARVHVREQPSFPLTLLVVATTTARLSLLFDRTRFRDEVVERLLLAVEQAVAEISKDEQRSLGELNVVPGAQRVRMLHEWNDTARAFPDQLRIHELFEQRVLEQPDAGALECGASRLSYRALEERSNQVAQALRARGVGPGDFVALCCERGLGLVIGMLGIAKSGAAYVPIDPRYPSSRIAFMLRDAQVKLVVTQAPLRGQFGEHQELVIGDEDDAESALVRSMPTLRVADEGCASDFCYAIFTSGSTGKPKGVVLSHRAVINTLDWVSREFAVGPGDRLLFVTSPCFDLSVYDVFGALGAGACVVIASDAELEDPALLAASIVDKQITIWDSAPAALQRLTHFFPSALANAALRLVMLSGDWIPLALPGTIRAAFTGARVVSLGGATEAAIWSNWFPIEVLDPRWTSIPYGRPIQNSRYHVLDRRLQPVPIGAVGDLYIGGTCLANGYLNRTELTQERFIADPLAQSPGERLYKTGDLARYFDDGVLEFLGRADFQLKIRGFRVELGELESALAELPGVRDAVGAAHADVSGQKSLVAYLVLHEGARLDADHVRKALAHVLPDFMLPSYVVFLDALPLSSNGKVDRNALPSPMLEAADTESVPPSTPLEHKLIALWQELLGRERIGTTDNFFALGGHSLLAVMLISRLRSDFDVELPLARVMQRPTIASLAEAIVQHRIMSSTSAHLITLNPGGQAPPLVLVAGVGGYAFTYRNLPSFFDADQPVYALQSVGTGSNREPRALSIEEMAEVYISQVAAKHPTGPLVLGGFSFGMLPAFELARQLQRTGREVPLLVSIEGFAPGYPKRMPFSERVRAHARGLFSPDPEERKAYIAGRIPKLRERLFTVLGRENELAPEQPFEDPDMRERMKKLWTLQRSAAERYQPQEKVNADLLLIRCEHPETWLGTDMDDPHYGWRSFVTGELRVVPLPGKHTTILDSEDNMQRMADAISRSIAALPGHGRAPGLRYNLAP